MSSTGLLLLAIVDIFEECYDITRPYFEQQLTQQKDNRRHASESGQVYHDNDLVIAKADGSPRRRECVSSDFKHLLQRLDMPHMRFHDTRHSASTNMHQLTGDFFTVGQILDHSLKGVGIQLGIFGNLNAVTAHYVDMRLERKLLVLDTYHQAVLGPGQA